MTKHDEHRFEPWEEEEDLRAPNRNRKEWAERRLPPIRRALLRLGIGREKERFENIMALAQELRRVRPDRLELLVRLVGGPAQARLMAGVAGLPGPVQGDPEPMFEDVWFPGGEPITPRGESFFQLMCEGLLTGETCTVDLGRDLVLPLAWSRERLLKNLVFIGPDTPQGPWRQRPDHFVQLWLPMRLAWVTTNGNHSITTGILRNEGEVETDDVYDLSPLYRHVECDGESFRRKHDGKILSRVRDAELASIFEIGRLMTEAGPRNDSS